MGSLRHEPQQRPRSPYHYPTRLHRPNYRPASPALSDITGAHPRRHNRPGSQGQQFYPGQMRPRIPSDTSIGQQERMHRMPRSGPPSGYYPGSRPDIPPMPAMYQHHIAVEQARMLKRSKKGSMSSGSTNLRADSDAPSSDIASPPTPKDLASMEGSVSPKDVRSIMDTVSGALRQRVSSGALYYDYSEQFEREHFLEHETDPVPTGFVSQIKTIIEERGPSVESSLATVCAPEVKVSIDITHSERPDIAELPASPVPRRITRDLVLKGLEPSSTIDDVGTSTKSPASGGRFESCPSDSVLVMPHTLNQESAPVSLHPIGSTKNRHSILSQTGSSVLDSSTLDFAVRYSIPMATGAGFGAAIASDQGSVPASPRSPGRSTEDGMSELLAGYQHTESQHESDGLKELGITPKKVNVTVKQVEKRANHAQKSSDEQSFKSCTDVMEPDPETASPGLNKNEDVKDGKKTTETSPGQGSSVKESDARSFTTAKNAVTPDRAASMPTPGLPSSNMPTSDRSQKRPASEVTVCNSPPAVLRKQPPAVSRESSFALASRFRAHSKPNMKQSKALRSGSSSSLSGTQQPPSVPLRESSSSKEAQRYQAVASFLIRQLPSRLAKGRSLAQGEAKPKKEGKELSFGEPARDTVEARAAGSSSQLPLEGIATPEKALIKQYTVTETQSAMSVITKDCNSSKDLGLDVASALHQDSPVIPEPSSVYSPQGVSLRSHAQSSPAEIEKPTDHGRRESQTTTHLVWHGRRSPNDLPADADEPQILLPGAQDDTTTNLRLSRYRYASPSRYLPDLKEESHEDSSLNTSASNLKNSSFRFPFGVPLGVRASVDEAIVFSRRSSMGSHKHGPIGAALGQARGLPSMDFSQMSLFEKLNEEFGLRNSRSLQDLPAEPHGLKKSGQQRSVSARELREKYHSLLAELDDELKNSGDSSQKTTTLDLITLKRSGSPERIMAEINQLTIPSVGGLTQRISELLPSLREYYKLGEDCELIEEEAIMEHAIEQIHEVGPPVQKRSSARLRPVPGSPNMIVIDDALFEELTGRESGNGNQGRDGIGAADVSDSDMDSDVKGKHTSVTHKRACQNVHTDLEAPSPAVLRPRSSTVGYQALRLSVDTTISSTRSLKSFVSAPTVTDTRPWNSDKNYPWATTTVPSVDISLPLPTAVKHSPHPGPSHLRNRLSEAPTISSFSSANTTMGSPFGTASDSNAYARQHRFSTFGRSGGQSHAAGERYPTSALTPPTAIFRDHSSAFDTSDDEDFSMSHNKSRLGLRKRFSSARKATLDTTNRAGRSKINPLELASPESAQNSPNLALQGPAGEARASPTNHRHTFRDAEGMRVADYHRNKIIDQIKKWWFKGGNLIRSLSRRNRLGSTST